MEQKSRLTEGNFKVVIEDDFILLAAGQAEGVPRRLDGRGGNFQAKLGGPRAGRRLLRHEQEHREDENDLRIRERGGHEGIRGTHS